MKLRTITIVCTNQTTRTFELADEDIQSFVEYNKDMDNPSLIFVDQQVVHTGLFENDHITQWIEKLFKPQKPKKGRK